MDNVIPIVLLLALVISLAESIPNFTTLGNLSDTSRQIGEFGLIVIGMTIVMLGGGIDLSVGSNFALANVIALGAHQCRTLAGGGGGCGDDRRRRPRRPRQWPPYRLSEASSLSDHARHFDAHSVDRRASAADLLGEDRLERRGIRRLGLYWLRLGSGRSVQRPGPRGGRDHRASRSNPAANRLADHGGRRVAPRRLQCRHPRSGDRLPDLCRFGIPDRPRRHALRGAPFRRRARHRARSRTRRRDRGDPGRQQRRGRPRLSRQSADGRDHRFAADERPRPSRP